MKPNAEVRVALDAFRRIVQALRTDARHGDRRGPLSHAQLFALQQIARHPRSSINDIAARTFTHQSSVSVVVQRLVRRGLVEKIAASHDRRRHSLATTARGRRVLRRAATAVPERLIAALSSLPAAEGRAFADVLTRIAEAVSQGNGHPPMFMEGRTKRTPGARRIRP